VAPDWRDLQALQHLASEGEAEQRLGQRLRNPPGAQVEDASSAICPAAAPWVPFPSSAKISRCGSVSICASSEKGRFMAVCLASVF
jgi:hypothetical protein